MAADVDNLAPPATIALLAPFGTGKSSVGHLLADELRTHKDLTVVRLSAEKHTGVARQRALVYSFAEALVEAGAAKERDVNGVLATLAESHSVEKLDLSSLAGTDYLRDHWKGLLKYGAAGVGFGLATLYLLGVVVAAVSRMFGWIDGNVFAWPLTTAWSAALAVASAVGASVAILAFVASSLGKSALTPAKVTTSQPRAEAADEVERVFGALVRLAKDTTLVIVVDDIDRLPASEVLEALAAIKTLQDVPRGNEPFFIIACDERIVERALNNGDSVLAQVPGAATKAAAKYLNKLFTVRRPLPPHVKQDMRTYAERRLRDSQPEHAGVQALGDRLGDVLDVLIHDGVDAPRHVIRLLNAFFGAYQVAATREGASIGRLHAGDVTGHPELLARLTVLQVDFAGVYADVLVETSVLSALDAVVGGDPDAPLSLVRSHLEGRGETDPVRFADPALASFLSRTKPFAAPGVSLVPLLYLRETEAVGVLGSRTAEEVRSALENGEADLLEGLLQESLDKIEAVTEHIVTTVRAARRGLPATNAVQTAASALRSCPDGARHVLANAVAQRIQEDRSTTPAPSPLADLIRFADASYGPLLRELLTDFGSETEPSARQARAQAIADLGAERPDDLDLPVALGHYFDTLPEEASWPAAPPWIKRMFDLNVEVRNKLVGTAFYQSVLRLSVGTSPQQIEEDAADQFNSMLRDTDLHVRSDGATWHAGLQAAVADGEEPRWFGLRAMAHLEIPPTGIGDLVAVVDAVFDPTSASDEVTKQVASAALTRIAATQPVPAAELAEEHAAMVGNTLTRGISAGGEIALDAVQCLRSWLPIRLPAVEAALIATTPVLEEHRTVDDALGRALRDAFLDGLDFSAAPAPILESLVSPIDLARSPEEPKAQFALETLPGLLEQHPELSPTLAARWHGLVNTQAPDPSFYLTPIAGLSALAARGLLDEATAGALVTRLGAIMSQGAPYHIPAALGLSKVAWPAPQRPEATGLIHQAWANLAEDQQVQVLRGVASWPPAAGEMAAPLSGCFTDLLLSTADDAVLGLGSALWAGLRGEDQARLVGRRIGDAPFLTDAPAGLDRDDLQAALTVAANSPRAALIAQALQPGTPSASEAVSTFLAGGIQEASPQWSREDAEVLVPVLSGEDSAALAGSAIDPLTGTASGMAKGAALLAILGSARPEALVPHAEALRDAAVAALPTCPPAVALDLGRATKGTDVGPYSGTLREMRKKGDQQQKEAVFSFEQGRQ